MGFLDEWWVGRLAEANVGQLRDVAAEAANLAGDNRAALATFQGVVIKRLATLEHQVKVQQAMIASLAELLIKANVVTAPALTESFDAMLAQLMPPPPAPQRAESPVGSPYRGPAPPGERSAPPRSKRGAPAKIACVACGKKVAPQATYVLGEGATCEECYRKRT